MNRAIGLVTALPAEARAITGTGQRRMGTEQPLMRSRLGPEISLVIAPPGPGVERAAAASERLAREGVAGLVASGVSGGLAPGLGPGDLIVADAVIGRSREKGLRTLWEDPSGFAGDTHGKLLAEGICARRGTIITVERPVLSPAEKRALFQETGALAVDMESAAVAVAAGRAGIAFLALRAVCDRADRSVPAALAHCLDQTGAVRLPSLAWAVLSRPALVFHLIRLGRDFHLALTALGKAWSACVGGSLACLVDPQAVLT